jgi:NTP pyrophosphatase (non-canonical NTP hydrolase)
MEKHFNNLTPAEAERLAILAEEMGEAMQIVGKILRHGYDSYNPFDDNKITNRQLLEKELGDVSYATQMLCVQGDITRSNIMRNHCNKIDAIKPYLHHQPEQEASHE